MRERFCGNSYRLQAINYFCKKDPSQLIRSKYASVNITLHLTCFEEHSLQKVDERFYLKKKQISSMCVKDKWRYCLCFNQFISCTNTRTCKHVNYHERICLSCNLLNFIITKNLKQEVDDDLSMWVDECSPCGLSIPGDVKIYQRHVIKI